MDLLDEFFVTGNKTNFLDSRTSPSNEPGMKPSTSKTSSSPPPEEPTVPFVNNNLPDAGDEPEMSDTRGLEQSDEIHRQKSLQAQAKYERTRPGMISDQRDVTAQLFNRFSEEEERKRIEQLKNKEAMNASTTTPVSRNSQIDSRKRRNEPTVEEEWSKRAQQQQWAMGAQNGQQFQMYHSQQQYMMMQQQQQMQMSMQHHHQMPSTSSADSIRSVPTTPASQHHPSPDMRNGMMMSSPMMQHQLHTGDENNIAVPEGDLFEQLVKAVANNYNVNNVLDQEAYDSFLNDFTDSAQKTDHSPITPNGQMFSPTPPPAQQAHIQQQNKMRMLQQQQQEMHRIEQQRQHHLMQQQQQRHQMLLQQQQHIQQQQHQMNGAAPGAPTGAGYSAAQQQQAAYMQSVRMQQMRYQQQQQQQQQAHPMGYGSMPNGYAQQMPMHHMPHHHPQAYQHHMPQHTPFANMN